MCGCGMVGPLGGKSGEGGDGGGVWVGMDGGGREENPQKGEISFFATTILLALLLWYIQRVTSVGSSRGTRG